MHSMECRTNISVFIFIILVEIIEKVQMLEYSRFTKNKSKCFKKPLELKNNRAESLVYNRSELKKQTLVKPIKFPKKMNSLNQKETRLIDLYNKLEANNKSESDSSKSDELIVGDLQKAQDLQRNKRKKWQSLDRKSIIFGHLMTGSQMKQRKMSQLEEKVNSQIKKYSLSSKNKQLPPPLFPKQPPIISLTRSSSTFTLAKASKVIQKSYHVQALQNKGGSVQLNLSNMKLTHFSIVNLKQQITKLSKLKILDLSFNNLTNKSMPLIIEILNSSMIEEVSIKWNQFSYQSITDLFRFIYYNSSLISLDVSYNKLTNSSEAFIQTLLQFLQKNKYLLHLNMEMCHIGPQQAAILAQNYNIKDDTILCIHFKGNSNYYVNKLGYIIKGNQQISIRNSTNQARAVDLSRQKFTSPVLAKYLVGEDCCWICQHWIKQQFKYYKEIPPNGIRPDYDEDYFIHINCYDYQPIKMVNSQCFNDVKNRIKQCKKIQFSSYSIYTVQLPVPSNKQVKYFFTNRGRVLVNQSQRIQTLNQPINFGVFDIFSQIYDDRTQQRYSVLVQRINYCESEQLSYNKLRRQSKNTSKQNTKCNIEKQHKVALNSIINKNQQKQNSFACQKDNRKQYSISRHSSNELEALNHLHFRKNKQITGRDKEQKYMYLETRPRNKNYLFNFCLFMQKSLAVSQLIEYKQQFLELKQKYFGFYRINYFSTFLKKRQLLCNQEQFIDKFKIVTRKYFNNNQLFFNDIFTFLYNTFLVIEKPINQSVQNKHLQRSKTIDNKMAPKRESKVSILINTQKNIEDYIHSEASEIDLKKKNYIQRNALSENFVNDKYHLSKPKAMPIGSINTYPSTVTNINSKIKLTKQPVQPSGNLLKLSLELNQTPVVHLNEETLINYKTISTQYYQRKLIMGLVNSFEGEKVKELNDIIQTYNYYKICNFYEKSVQEMVRYELRDLNSSMDLLRYIKVSDKGIHSSQKSIEKGKPDQSSNFSLQTNSLQETGEQKYKDLQARQKNLQSFLNYLIDQNHPLKQTKHQANRNMCKKRTGKYGRSLKNIKQQLMKETNRIIIPTNSSQFLLEIEREQAVHNYNIMIKELNVISDVYLSIVDQIIAEYFQTHTCNQSDQEIIGQWLRNFQIKRISLFISQTLKKYKNANFPPKNINKPQIFQAYNLNTIIELVKFDLMLKCSKLQQNLKEYQFISPFHSYQFIISIEITKMVRIIKALQQDSNIIQDKFSQVLGSVAKIWKKYEANISKGCNHQEGQPSRANIRSKKPQQTLSKMLEKQSSN